MTPCCRFARSLVPFAALLPLSPSRILLFVYISIGLSFATPNRCNNISLFSAPFCNLIDCSCVPTIHATCHLVRLCPCPWDKAIEPEDQSHLISNLFACNMCRSAFPLALAAAAPSRGPPTVPDVPSPPLGASRAGKAKIRKTRRRGKRTYETHATPGLNCCLRLSSRRFLFPFL